MARSMSLMSSFMQEEGSKRAGMLQILGEQHAKPTFRALVVGVSYLKQPWELKGSLNDISRLEKVLLGRLADPNNIRVLHELQHDRSLQPTAENIREGIRWLLDGARPKDHLLFYFSGCGSQTLVDDSPESTLLPCDMDWGDRIIPYSELKRRLYESAPKGCHVTAIIDACFQTNVHDACSYFNIWRETAATRSEAPRGIGAIWGRRKQKGINPTAPWRCIPPPKGVRVRAADGVMRSSGLSPLLFLFGAGLATPSQSTKEWAPFVLYEACRTDGSEVQGAWDVFLADAGCTVGLFTYALCSVLEDPRICVDGTLKWWELHEHVCWKMKATPYDQQDPCFYVGDAASLELPVFPTLVATAEHEEAPAV